MITYKNMKQNFKLMSDSHDMKLVMCLLQPKEKSTSGISNEQIILDINIFSKGYLINDMNDLILNQLNMGKYMAFGSSPLPSSLHAIDKHMDVLRGPGVTGDMYDVNVIISAKELIGKIDYFTIIMIFVYDHDLIYPVSIYETSYPEMVTDDITKSWNMKLLITNEAQPDRL